MAACDGWLFVLAETDIGAIASGFKKNIQQNQIVDRFTQQQKHSGLESETVRNARHSGAGRKNLFRI
jgi:hypothetical protein